METVRKQKVTVTIEKRLLAWTDKQIESFWFRNRSHAFEYALAKLIVTEKKTAERHDQLLKRAGMLQ